MLKKNKESYRRRLELKNAVVNLSSKIWIFWAEEWEGLVISDTVQQLTVKFTHTISQKQIIITAEVLSRGLNKLYQDPDFRGYGMPKWSPEINHLSYADDTILFCSGHHGSMKKMMKVLKDYEMVSGQLINLTKSFLYLHEKVPIADCIRIRRVTGIGQGSFPFIYLGCPIFYGRRRKDHFEELLKKVRKRIMLWQKKLLSFGGRFILVAHVLQSMPVYLLTTMNPPKGVIKQLHMIFAKFFWSNIAGSKGKHWVAWEDMCLPKNEGGLGFRSLQDVSKAMFAKLWWNFRVSTDSIWSAFMWNKYC